MECSIAVCAHHWNCGSNTVLFNVGTAVRFDNRDLHLWVFFDVGRCICAYRNCEAGGIITFYPDCIALEQLAINLVFVKPKYTTLRPLI